MLTCEHLTFVGTDLPACVKIALIANQHDGHVGVTVLLHLFQPSGQMSERVSPGDIVYKEGTGSASVVGPSDALE